MGWGTIVYRSLIELVEIVLNMLKRKDKLVGFLLAEAVHHEAIEAIHHATNFRDELLTLFGKVDVVKSAINGMRCAEDESGIGELVDDAHHGSFVDAEVFDQILLGDLPCFVVEVQHEREVFARNGMCNHFTHLGMVLLEDHGDAAAEGQFGTTDAGNFHLVEQVNSSQSKLIYKQIVVGRV